MALVHGFEQILVHARVGVAGGRMDILGRRSRAEEMGFVAGAEWSEGVAGTNAPGTALTLNAPVQIFASEHFRGTVQPWSCTAVPIHDPHTGRVLGVLDVTGESQVATPQALAMVRATAMAVEQWLAVQQPAQANAQLLVLGRRRGVLRRDGNEQQLSTRHSELMVLLAATSEGLTGERLAVKARRAPLGDQAGAP